MRKHYWIELLFLLTVLTAFMEGLWSITRLLLDIEESDFWFGWMIADSVAAQS